jgi:hypothetical protein
VIRPGDVVAIRNAAYRFDAEPGRRRPRRIENGQVGVVDSVDPRRDRIRVWLREPGAAPRLVEIDQARLRAQRAAGESTPAVRLNYAMHSFPAQGATLRGTAALAGHWSQARKETYVGDTRAVYRHTVHVAREDLGVDGTDEDRIARYGARISHARERVASIRSALDRSGTIAVELPERRLAPRQDLQAAEGPGPRGRPAFDPSRGPAGELSREDRRRALEEHLERALADPPEHLTQALGPPPAERIARERWEREARRLEALRFGAGPSDTSQPPAQPGDRSAPGRSSSPTAPASPPPRRHKGPSIGR